MTIQEAMDNQPTVKDHLSQDKFNIQLTKEKRDAITKARKQKEALFYTPRNDFNTYSSF